MTVALADRPKGRANSFDPATVLVIRSEPCSVIRNKMKLVLRFMPRHQCSLKADLTVPADAYLYNHVYVINKHYKVATLSQK